MHARPSRRVLVVDEYDDAADGLADLLRASGLDASSATTLEAALAAFDTLPPRLLLIDWVSRRHVGTSMLRRIIEGIVERRLDVYIIVVSAFSPPDPFDLRAHIDAYLEKPCSLERLKPVLDLVFGGN